LGFYQDENLTMQAHSIYPRPSYFVSKISNVSWLKKIFRINRMWLVKYLIFLKPL